MMMIMMIYGGSLFYQTGINR